MLQLRALYSWMKKNWERSAWIGFGFTRLLIFLFPPEYVRYFETYANIWYYGLPPYLKHWYEYPPATIPFVITPLWLDLAGIGKYRFNFRVLMFSFDLLIFAVMILMLRKMKYSSPTRLLCIGFYLALTLKGKDFMYENIDSFFALTMLLPALAPLLLPKVKTGAQWFLFWLGTGLKLVNLPLGWLYFWHAVTTEKTWSDLLKKARIPVVTFLLIRLVPVLMYRSSLSVIVVYHQQRGLQAEAIPSLVVRGINIFTQTEEIFFSEAKSYDLRGPVTTTMTPLALAALVVAMLAWAGYVFIYRDQAGNTFFLMKATLIFVLSYIVTNKVFSTPYHWWYVALLTLYSYKNNRERLTFFGVTAIFLGVAMSRIPVVRIGSTDLATIIPVVFQIPASLWLLIATYRLSVPEEKVVLEKVKKS